MKIFASYSIKGGVGKTSLSVNLSYAFRCAGLQTLLVDLDPQGAATFYFRVSSTEKFPLKGDGLSVSGLREAIRESDYSGLDILPASPSYRKFDIALDGMRKSRKQLRFLMDELASDYDAVVLDCPPGLTLLSENVFRASDLLLVPVIPTVLSSRTLAQAYEFFAGHDLPAGVIRPFFSMVQSSHRMHHDLMATLPAEFPAFLKTAVPHAASVEKMGLHRSPIQTFDPDCPAARAYAALSLEVLALRGQS